MSNGSLMIRDARSDEIEAVGELLLEAYREFAAQMPPEAWEGYSVNIRDVQGRWNEADTIVAESNGRLVGTATLYLDSQYNDAWPRDWAGVRLLGVHPDGRGKGVGRALMHECIRRSRERGASHLGLHTTSLMETARAMYERMGFLCVPEYDLQVAPGIVVSGYSLDLTNH